MSISKEEIIKMILEIVEEIDCDIYKESYDESTIEGYVMMYYFHKKH